MVRAARGRPHAGGVAMRRWVAIAPALFGAACWREQRDLRQLPANAERSTQVRLSNLQPGVPLPAPGRPGAYQNNAHAISEGQQLFGQYNCSGCHFHGGGGIGPPLMDDYWIYGSDPQNVYESIAEGRPNGMPSFAGHIPSYQIWEIAAYVRSLSGLERADAVAPRNEEMAWQSQANPQASSS